MADSVNHPVYYTNVSIECIEAMRISFGPTATFNFCICNAFKYYGDLMVKVRKRTLERHLSTVTLQKRLQVELHGRLVRLDKLPTKSLMSFILT